MAWGNLNRRGVAAFSTGTAYVAGNEAATIAAPTNGPKIYIIQAAIDTATTIIVRAGSQNVTLNLGANLVVGALQNWTIVMTEAFTIRFGNNCNIYHLSVTEEHD